MWELFIGEICPLTLGMWVFIIGLPNSISCSIGIIFGSLLVVLLSGESFKRGSTVYFKDRSPILSFVLTFSCSLLVGFPPGNIVIEELSPIFEQLRLQLLVF